MCSIPEWQPEFSPHRDEKISIKACVSYYSAWDRQGGEGLVGSLIREHGDTVSTSFCLLHGLEDTVVLPEATAELEKRLGKTTCYIEKHNYKGYGHAYAYQFFCPENLNNLVDVLPFIADCMSASGVDICSQDLKTSLESVGSMGGLEIVLDKGKYSISVCSDTPAGTYFVKISGDGGAERFVVIR